jgi:hypothetical protein
VDGNVAVVATPITKYLSHLSQGDGNDVWQKGQKARSAQANSRRHPIK